MKRIFCYILLVCSLMLSAQRAVVIVLPGGSYCWLDHRKEGKPTVQWLQEQGFVAEELSYPVTGWWGWATGTRSLVGSRNPRSPLEAVQKVVVEARNRYPGLPVGVMGYSAGGHLALLTGECFDASNRPDFVTSIYPVVTMHAPYVHKRSRRALLGRRLIDDQQMRESLSLEQNVRADMPPVFLLNCLDDPIVQCQNSVLMDSALTANGVRHTYIQYKKGGHGFGMSSGNFTSETSHWQQAWLNWFTNEFAR